MVQPFLPHHGLTRLTFRYTKLTTFKFYRTKSTFQITYLFLFHHHKSL
ncbi:hypothetical protein [Sulfolobus spindle-shaped virus]|nr:hypothetical protein [Sulfolobus spindle-shaped virus]